MMGSPFTEHTLAGADGDEELVRLAKEGDRAALDALVGRHQVWVYNLALRMLHLPEDAADATQEILVKAVVRLGSFAGRSRFSTWLYRIATNHLLNQRRLARSLRGITFESFGATLAEMPDADVPDSDVPASLLVRESLVSCTSAMLLCLSAEQRIAYIFGEIFGASDRVGAEVLGISPAAFRKRLSRARRDLHAFMNGQCGLIDPQNPCRCAKKTKAFIDAGHIDPDRLVFTGNRTLEVHDLVPDAVRQIDAANRKYVRIYREHGLHELPEGLIRSLRKLLHNAALVHGSGTG